MKVQQYSSMEAEVRRIEKKLRERGSVSRGDAADQPAQHMPRRSSGRHTVHHKHHSDRRTVGWQKEGHRRKVHHREKFHRGDRCRAARHKDARCKTDHRMDHRGAQDTAGPGKDCTSGHSKDPRRDEGEHGGNRVLLAVSSGWTGRVCTP